MKITTTMAVLVIMAITGMFFATRHQTNLNSCAKNPDKCASVILDDEFEGTTIEELEGWTISEPVGSGFVGATPCCEQQ